MATAVRYRPVPGLAAGASPFTGWGARLHHARRQGVRLRTRNASGLSQRPDELAAAIQAPRGDRERRERMSLNASAREALFERAQR